VVLLNIKDAIIGLIGIVVLILAYAPIVSLVDKFTSKLSGLDSHILTLLFFLALFIGGYWYFKLFGIKKEKNDNIDRDFHDYM